MPLRTSGQFEKPHNPKDLEAFGRLSENPDFHPFPPNAQGSIFIGLFCLPLSAGASLLGRHWGRQRGGNMCDNTSTVQGEGCSHTCASEDVKGMFEFLKVFRKYNEDMNHFFK